MLYPLLSALVVSSLSLLGLVLLPFRKSTTNDLLFFFISFATGSLFGDAFLHIVPEVYDCKEHSGRSSLLILSGIVGSFMFEKFLRWKQHGGCEHAHIKPVGRIILAADSVHNLIDGILIGASYMVDIRIGITTTLAVILHEIPHEIGDFAVLLSAGYSWAKAVLFNAVSALFAVLGVILAVVCQSKMASFSQFVLPITAGSFIYIGGANLVPELHCKNDGKSSIYQCVFIVLGIGLMGLLLLLEK
jgi:zinc and cadmium transporter